MFICREEGKQILIKFYSETVRLVEQLTHFILLPHTAIYPFCSNCWPWEWWIDKKILVTRPLLVHSLALKVHVEQLITTKYGKCWEKVCPRSVGTESRGIHLKTAFGIQAPVAISQETLPENLFIAVRQFQILKKERWFLKNPLIT